MTENVANEKWGVLGGSFNPVHLGHLHLARTAARRSGLSRVLFIPAATPPHKLARVLAPTEHRLAMLHLALSAHDNLEVSSMELHRGGISFTYQTMAALTAAHSSIAFYFLIGSDTLAELHTWRRIDLIARMVTFLIMRRTEMPHPTPPPALEEALRGTPLDAQHLVAEPLPISSTEIRSRVRRQQSIKGLVPVAVENYIRKKGLYRGAVGGRRDEPVA